MAEEESECKTPQKAKKRVKYEEKLKFEYRDEFKCITKLSFGDTFAFCNVCCCDINIAHVGRDDLRKHCATQNNAYCFSLFLNHQFSLSLVSQG